MRTLCLLAWTAVALCEPAIAADAPSAAQIVDKVKAVLEPSKPAVRKLVFTVSSEGDEVQIVARQASKQFPDGKKMLTVMLEPNGIRGTASLTVEPAGGKPTKTWIYVPYLRRVKELIPVEANDSFANTDFTYADLGFVRVHADYKSLGREEKDGTSTYKVEETVPTESFYYSKILTWVAIDGMYPVQRDYYDPAGALWKHETFGPLTQIDGVPTILQRQMKNAQIGTGTTLDVESVRYDVELPDALFDPKEMSKAADHPLWKDGK